MKTRREASSLGCSAFSASRAAATSGRSCSHAWRTFFERDLVAVVETPPLAHGDAELLLSTKSFADFLQRQIGLLGNEVEQPILVRLERRPAVASAGFIFDAACRRPQVEPTHCCRSGDVEQARDLAPALTLLDQCNRARTQVIRVPPRHGISPPLLTEQPESDYRGRDGDFPPPPARIRTGPTKTYGSYLEWVTRNRWSGHGCCTRGDGRKRAISRHIRSHVSRCR